MTHKFLKIAGVKNEKEFYSKFPTEEAFFKAHPDAAPSMKSGGTISAHSHSFPNTDIKGEKMTKKQKKFFSDMCNSSKMKKADWGMSLDSEDPPIKTLNTKGTLPYNDFTWNTPTITGQPNNVPANPNAINPAITPGWAYPAMPQGGYLNNNKEQIWPGSGGLKTYNPPNQIPNQGGMSLIGKEDNPAWQNSGNINGQQPIAPVYPNQQQLYTNPDYIENKGEGQLNRGQVSNLTEGQKKHDKNALNPNNSNVEQIKQPKNSSWNADGSAGDVALTALMAVDAFLPKEKIRRKYLRPEDLPTAQDHIYGRGSQAISKYGATIKGKKEKAFWGALLGAVGGGGGAVGAASAAGGSGAAAAGAASKAGGMMSQLGQQGAQQAASGVMDGLKQGGANLTNNIAESLAPLMQISHKADAEAQRLNNAYLNGQIQDLSKLQDPQYPQMNMGGQMPGMQGQYYGRVQQMRKGGEIQTHNGGQTKMKSYNPFDGGTMQFNGQSHEQGGIDISFAGKPVEVEGQETAFKDAEGNLKIMGNLKVPGTKMKYKELSKKLADREIKAQKFVDKGTLLLNTANPSDPYERLSFNSGQAMVTGGLQKQKQLAAMKEHLGNMQEFHLELINEQAPKKYRNGGTIAANGATVEGDPIYEAMLKAAAEKYGVNYETIKRMVEQESSFTPGKISNTGAMGVMQFMEKTGRQYGLTKAELLSKDPKDIEKQIEAGVKHFKYLQDKYNNDEGLAVYAYNMGEGNVNKFIKASGKNKNEYTSIDLDQRLEQKRASSPSNKLNLAQNQSYEYKKNVYAPVVPAEEFRKKYYEPIVDAATAAPEVLPYNTPNVDFKPNTAAPETVQGNSSPFNFKQVDKRKKPSNAAPLKAQQLLGEMYAMATNREEPVKAQLYQPDLFSPYQVSFQDRLNENNATFNGIQKQLAYSPTALATLAGQQYQANSQVLGEEFRTNQGIANDIINKNVSLLNEAKKTNLGILDTQYVRQSQAHSNTKSINQDALNSISSKMLQKEASNNALRVYENMYHDYAFDKRTGEAQYYGIDANARMNEMMGISGIDQASGQPDRTKITTKTGNTTSTQYYDDPIVQAINRRKYQDLTMNSIIPAKISMSDKKPNLSKLWNLQK